MSRADPGGVVGARPQLKFQRKYFFLCSRKCKLIQGDVEITEHKSTLNHRHELECNLIDINNTTFENDNENKISQNLKMTAIMKKIIVIYYHIFH